MRLAHIILSIGVLLAGGCAKTMKLSTDKDTKIDNPSREQIKAVLIDISNRPADAYIIIGETEMTYMQAAGDKEKRFIIEYQEGTLAKHFRTKGRLSMDQALEIFSSYCRGGTEWKTAATWEPAPVGQ
jgi:hypothetical protein